jgi:hypothetical protein
MMQFYPNQTHYSNDCCNEADMANEIQWATNVYNLATPSAPVDLVCSEYGFTGGPGGPGDHSGNTWGQTTEWESEWVDNCFGWVFQYNNMYEMNFITNQPCDEAGLAPNQVIEYQNAIDNIVSIQVSSISNGSFRTVNLNPENVIPQSGIPFVSHNTDFETGVYILRFFFSDGSNYTTIVTHNSETDPVVNNAAFATLSIVPNPVIDSWLKLDLTVERYMKFELEVLTLNGDILHAEWMSMEEDTQASKGIRLPNVNFPSNQLIVRMKFQDGSILQQTALINN